MAQNNNPWLGLQAYHENDILYGRDDDIRSLSQQVFCDIDTVLYGKSGIGKSSIINAGIIPVARRNDYVPVYIRLEHSKDLYVNQIIGALATEGVDVVNKVAVNTIPLFWELFHANEFYKNGQRVKLLIIFDQFEEIFTLQQSAGERRAFFENVADFLNDVIPSSIVAKNVPEHSVKEVGNIAPVAVSGEFTLNLEDFNFGSDTTIQYVDDNEVHLIFTLREDFLSDFEYYTSSIPSLKQHRYALRPINEEQATEIILRPRPGLVSKDVARLIIEKVSGRKDFALDGLPEIEIDSAVLSLYLNRLYEEKESDVITEELVEKKGGAIISDFYDSCIKGISAEAVDYLEDVLINDEGRRENKSLNSLYKDVGRQNVDLLIERQLLRKYAYAGSYRVEFIHDILCPIICERIEKREQLRIQEEEYQRMEEEKQRLLAEEEQKRQEIELEALKERRRNRNRLFAMLSIIVVGLLIFATYWYYNEWERVAYYRSFMRVNGWPVGVGRELSKADLARIPLYYRLSHKGNQEHDTDVRIMSSNAVLPNSPRIPMMGAVGNPNGNTKARAYYDKLCKAKHIHFVEGENEKIDKEIIYDENGDPLFVMSYFHLNNRNEAWVKFLSTSGQVMEIDDNGIDRMKLSWYGTDTDMPGYFESIMFYDAQGIPNAIQDQICGYSMRYMDGGNTMWVYLMDEFGRALKSPNSNLIVSTRSANSKVTIYNAVISVSDTISIKARSIDGYHKIIEIGDTLKFYGVDEQLFTTKVLSHDAKGNLINECYESKALRKYPKRVNYKYDQKGHLVCVEKLGPNGLPFSSSGDSIYKKEWAYSDAGELILERHTDINQEVVYCHEVDYRTGGVVKYLDIDKAQGKHLLQIDSVGNNVKTITYYTKNNIPFNVVKQEGLEKKDTIRYHRKIVRNNPDSTLITSEFYIYDAIKGAVVPCPKNLVDWQVLSYFKKEQQFDADGNQLWYRLYDRGDTILKSMMYFYQNGQTVARAAMGVDGTPVRCPHWEEEGFAYYKLLYTKDFSNKFINVQAVDEFGIHSVFYDHFVAVEYMKSERINYEDSVFYRKDTTRFEITDNYVQQHFVRASDISNVSHVFLHILTTKSSLYSSGLKDGDRIIELGRWKRGKPETILVQEWKRLLEEELPVVILRPVNGSYQTHRFEKIRRNAVAEEEYHIYHLSATEFEYINKIKHEN